MKTLYLLFALNMIHLVSFAQKPSVYSNIPSGTVGDLSFINNDTAFCFSGYNVHMGINQAKDWTAVSTLQFGGAYTFTALDAKNNIVIAGMNSGGRYIISKNSGKDWSETKFIGKNLQVTKLKIIDANTIYAVLNSVAGVIDSVILYVSTNGGESWQRRSTFTSRGSNAKVHFLNANKGLLYHNKYLYKTDDGGITWSKPIGYDTLENVYSTFILSDQISYVGQDAGGLLKSTNNSSTYSIINANSGLDYENQIYFKDELNGFVTEGYTRNFKLKKTIDGGATWALIADSVNFRYFAYVNDQNIYLYGANNNIYKVSASATSVSNQSKNNLKIYPNPAQGIVYLNLDYSTNEKIKIYSITGNLITELDSREGINKIIIENSGMYFLKVGDRVSEKIIIR